MLGIGKVFGLTNGDAVKSSLVGVLWCLLLCGLAGCGEREGDDQQLTGGNAASAEPAEDAIDGALADQSTSAPARGSDADERLDMTAPALPPDVRLELPTGDGRDGDTSGGARGSSSGEADVHTGLELADGLSRAELFQFIPVADEHLRELFGKPRDLANAEALTAEIRRVARLKQTAAERLLALEELSDEEQAFAIRTKLQAMSHQAATGDVGAGDRLQVYATSLLNHPSDEVSIDSRTVLVSLELDRLQGGLVDGPGDVLRLAQQLTGRPELMDVAAVKVAERTMQVLGRYGYADEAQQVQQWLSTAVSSSPRPEVQQLGAEIVASVRFEALQSLRSEVMENGPQPAERWREEAERVLADGVDAMSLNYLATLGLQLEAMDMLPAAEVIHDVLRERFSGVADEVLREGAGMAITSFVKRQAMVGELMPELPSKTILGKPFNPATLRGEIVVLPFWSTQQPDSLAALAETVRFVEQSTQPVRLVGIAVEPTMQGLQAAQRLSRERLEFPNLAGIDASAPESPTMLETLGISSLPVVVVVDPRGRIAKIALSQTQLEDAIRSIQLP